MKKSIISICIVLLININYSFSQDHLYSRTFHKAASYSIKAESAICKNSLDKAESYYDTLFNITPNPSGRDVWNRALLAKQTGNEELQDSMVHILFYKGYSLDKIGKCFDTLKLQHLITPEYIKITSNHNVFTEKIMKDDQRVNMNKRINPEEWLDTWILNIVKIMDYVHKVDSLNIPFFTLESSKLHISILHYFQMWGNSKVMSNERFAQFHSYMKGLSEIDFEENGLVEFLIKQVEKGQYSKNMLAHNLSFSKYSFPYSVVNQYDSLIFVKEPYMLRNTGELDSINYWRNYLGVSTYEQYYSKSRFIDSLQNNGNVFKPIPKDSIYEYFDRINSYCSYLFVNNYRMTMFMKYSDGAEKAIIEMKRKYGIKD